VLFAPVLASLRGYFQGFQQMLPTASSQVAEQFFRVSAIIIFAVLLLPRGLEYAAAGAALGTTPGTLAGLAILTVFYRRRRLPAAEAAVLPAPAEAGSRRLLWKLARLALPVSLANIIVPLDSALDALIVPMRLEAAGYSVPEATALFGYLSGMALPLLLLATLPTTSLATSLVPAIAEAHALKDAAALRERVRTALRVSCLITLPASLGLAALAEPVSRLLYATAEAASPIRIIALGIFFLGAHQTTAAVLQGIGRAGRPMTNMAAGACLKVALSWFLTALPAWGIAGAAWASVSSFALTFLLNILFLYKHTGLSFIFAVTGRIAAAAGGAALAARQAHAFLLALSANDNISTILAIAAGGLVYCLLLPLFSCVTRADADRIPVLKKCREYFFRGEQ
jgi:stage V sporulation protein B